MNILAIMRALGASTGSLSMHRPASLGLPGGLIFLSLDRSRAVHPVRLYSRCPIETHKEKISMKIKILAIALLTIGLTSTNAQAQTEIQWWH